MAEAPRVGRPCWSPCTIEGADMVAVELGKIARYASKGWSWWTAELQACVPARLRALMAPTNIRIDVAQDAITVWRSARSPVRFALPLDEDGRTRLTRT